MSFCPRCSALCGEMHTFCFACGAELAKHTPQEDPLVGRTLPGGYRVTHAVGVGGMGRVYCAEQVALGRTVAVKVVHPHLADDELTVARFLNEARAASRMSHPNSVAIFDFGRTEQGQPYIVMEYLRGRDLARVADAEGPLPLRRVGDIMRQTLAALGEAHALGIVHRDLKPDNIVLEPLRSGLDFVKVVDFGLAKILENDQPSPSSGGGALTRPGLVCGTPEYMSPEQGRGDPLDGRADLYALGVVLYELLAGRVPFVADTATKILLAHLNEPVPDPRSVAPDRMIPEQLAQLCLRALAKPRDDRFQTAEAFAAALDEALIEVEGRASYDATPRTSIRCRGCGALNGMGQKFCGECGAQISTSGAAKGTASALAAASASGAPPPTSSPKVDARAPTEFRASAPSFGDASTPLPLLARADAIAWLEGRRHEADAAFASAPLVGEAGGGKSRLVRELSARCALRGDTVVVVGPDPAWAKLGDWVVRQAVSALAELPEGDEAAATWKDASAEAKRGLELLFGAGEDAPDTGERRAALADALRWAMQRAATLNAGGGLVLVVEDLDFVDGTSRNAVMDVLAEPPVACGLVVVTYSPGANPAQTLPGETWNLSPLPVDSFANLLPTRVASPPRPLVPLHVEQLIAWARESNDQPPERLADLIARRAERLPADARHTLHALSVWGECISDVLKRLLPTGVDARGALDALERAGMVTTDEKGVRIAHPLVRRVVFSSIPAGLKRDLFARAAELRPDAPIEIRAKQAMHGGSALEALSLLELVSRRRAAHGDIPGSVSALRHGLDVARRELHRGELDDPVSAMMVFSRKLAEALAESGKWNDAEGILREALGNAPPTSQHRARLLGVLAQVAHARKQVDEARKYLVEAKRLARTSDARELLPMLETLERSIEVA
ncbi:MAG TPA: protein kinase [Polyangiaceae bacterium]|nr:protein kinase [Polyangiaceae bacterium]